MSARDDAWAVLALLGDLERVLHPLPRGGDVRTAPVFPPLLPRPGEVSGEALDIDDLDEPPDRSAATLLYAYRSPTLAELAQPLLKDSINLYGEAAMRLNTPPGMFANNDAAIEGMRMRMDAWGIPREAWQIIDGSGLSRRNTISAAAVAAILERMYDADGDYIGSLSVVDDLSSAGAVDLADAEDFGADITYSSPGGGVVFVGRSAQADIQRWEVDAGGALEMTGELGLGAYGVTSTLGRSLPVIQFIDAERALPLARAGAKPGVLHWPGDILANAAERTVVVGWARIGPADLHIGAAVAEDGIDAEQPDLDIGPIGADENVAVLQALITAAARESRVLRLHERIVHVVVVGADLLLRAGRAEPRGGGDRQAEDGRKRQTRQGPSNRLR